MKILLDTHILLWALQDSKELPDKARYIIQEEDNSIFYSMASLWEVQIKHLNHPKEMTLDVKQLEKYCVDSGFHICPIRSEHIHYLAKLKTPKNLIHKDPFDKIMICQAATEGMLFVTKDSRMVKYSEPCIYEV